MTSYLIMQQQERTEREDVWQDVGTVEASSAPTAIRRWAEQQGAALMNGAAVRCIPARHAKPVEVAAITQVRITLS